MSASQIREVISNYLSGGDAERFAQEFSALSYNIHKHGDSEAISLVNRIEIKMTDLHEKLIDMSAFKDFLRDIAASPISGAYIRQPHFYTASCAHLSSINVSPVWGPVEASSVRFVNRTPALVSE